MHFSAFLCIFVSFCQAERAKRSKDKGQKSKDKGQKSKVKGQRTKVHGVADRPERSAGKKGQRSKV